MKQARIWCLEHDRSFKAIMLIQTYISHLQDLVEYEFGDELLE